MINASISNFTREQIKNGLADLPESWQLMFKRMYSHDNLELPMEDVVNRIPEEKLDWALTQVESSLKKLQTQ